MHSFLPTKETLDIADYRAVVSAALAKEHKAEVERKMERKEEIAEQYKRMEELTMEERQLKRKNEKLEETLGKLVDVNVPGIFSFKLQEKFQDVSGKYNCPSTRKIFQYDAPYFSTSIRAYLAVAIVDFGDNEFSKENSELVNALFFQLFPGDATNPKLSGMDSSLENYQIK